MIRVGLGFDIHAFEEGRGLWLGGVNIPSVVGLKGHSDADVVLHAVMDALLGAAGLGDIGQHFPDTDPAYKGIASVRLLEHVASLIRSDGYRVGNLDVVIMAEKPRVMAYAEQMKSRIAAVLDIETTQVNIKATTLEKLGALGRAEGIASEAVVLLFREGI